MAWTQLTNNAKTTLSAGCTDVATAITPTAKTTFPDPEDDGSFYATIWDADTYPDPGDDPGMEIVLVTADAAANWTVTRGQAGTAGAAHVAGDAVRLLWLAEHAQEIQDAIDLNTAARHAAVTVADTTSVDLTLTGQQVSAAVLPAGVDHNALLNYSADRHYLQTAIDHVSTGLATGLLKVTTGTGALSVAVASDLPAHATAHESGGGDQVNHDSLTGFVANEHIDWTNASNNLLTSGTGQLARMGVGCAPAVGTTQCVQETFTTPGADGNCVDVRAILAPSGALSTTTRIRALRGDAQWNSAVDGGTYGTVYGIEGLAKILSAASGNLRRASGMRASVVHYGSGAIGQAEVVYSLLDNNDLANETGDITAGYNYLAACATDKGTGVIGTRYGLYVADVSGGGLCTTQYGLYVAALSGAGTNVAAYLGGDVQIAGGLDVASTNKAFIPPRMTTAQRDAIASPAAGMVVYNTTTNVLNFYNGSTWGAV